MEIWKHINNYNGLYEISNLGRVRNKHGKVLIVQMSAADIAIIQLTKNGKRNTIKIEETVAAHFNVSKKEADTLKGKLKVVDFELSKKLHEIGFRTEAKKCWAFLTNYSSREPILINLDSQIVPYCDEYYPAYDFETLLDILPKTITTDIYAKHLTLEYPRQGDAIIGYKESLNFNPTLRVYSWDNNYSLSDIAARLLIKMHQMGLVKFGSTIINNTFNKVPSTLIHTPLY